MRRLLTIATMTLICTVAYSQSTQRQAFQEVRVDTMRPNHYGPVWGIVFAWHDSVRVRIFRDSMNVKNISGDTAVFKYYKNAFTYDTTNHNARFAADTTYRAAQESAIRSIIQADTLYRGAQESAIRAIIAADTLYRAAQEAAIRAVQAADSTYKAAQLLTKVNVKDTTTSASGSYVTPTQFRTDTTYKAAQLLLRATWSDTSNQVRSWQLWDKGGSWLEVTKGSRKFFAKNDTTYTKQSILDSLNAASPDDIALTRKVAITKTTGQLRLGYDGSNYTSFTVASSGLLTIAPTLGRITLQGVAAKDVYFTMNNAEAAGYYTIIQYQLANVAKYYTGIDNGGNYIFREGTNNTDKIYIFGGTAGDMYLNYYGGNVSIGTAPAAKLHVQSATEQLRLGYDASNYTSFTVGATGGLAIGGAGTNGGSVSGTVLLRDTSAFTTTGLQKAIYIAGALQSDIYVLTPRYLSGATPVAGDLLSYWAKPDSLVVTRAVGTTNGLKFSFIRIR